MSYRLDEIARSLGLRCVGDGSLRITHVAEPSDAGETALALAMKPAFVEALTRGKARAALTWDGADWQSFGLDGAILAPRPRFAMAGLSAMMDPGQDYGAGIHPSAVIDATATLGDGVSVGAFSMVGAGARIGAGTRIGPHCHVGADSAIGPDGLLHAGVRILARVRIGARFIAQPGAVVGGDGFSFVTPDVSSVERVRDTLGAQGDSAAQSWARIHSLGSVTIGDDVELGANSCIDRGTVRDTRVGNGVKFDNLVQIGHNVVIGNDCLICAQVGIAGSSVIGNNVVLGGQSGVSDNITIGDNVITGGGTKVLSRVPAGRVMLGYPAMKMDQHIELYKSLRRLPRLFRDIAAGQKAVSKPPSDD